MITIDLKPIKGKERCDYVINMAVEWNRLEIRRIYIEGKKMPPYENEKGRLSSINISFSRKDRRFYKNDDN